MLKYALLSYSPLCEPIRIYIHPIILIFHKMTEYINKFSYKEKQNFRRDGSHKKTVCRVLLCVKSTETIKPKTFQTASTSCRAHHAEFLALLKITKDLFGYLNLTDKTKITEFDLVIRLNNNPCTTCQSFIKFWIQSLQVSN